MELVNGHPSMLERFWSSHRPILESQRCIITMRLLLTSRTPPPQGGWVGAPPPSSGVRFSHVFCAAGENKLKIPPPPRGGGYTDGAFSHVFPFLAIFGLLVQHGMCGASFLPFWPMFCHFGSSMSILALFTPVARFGPLWPCLPFSSIMINYALSWAILGHWQLLQVPSC